MSALLFRAGRWTGILLACELLAMLPAHADETARVVPAVPAASHDALYPTNRPPLAASPLVKLPIGSIRPHGWLRGQLELQAAGMCGRLAEISPWLRFESNAWANPQGKGHSGWEEMPYWLKGYGDLGYVLGDEAIIQHAKKWIDAILAGQADDGWLGPRELQKSLGGQPDLWPNMVVLNALQSYQEYSGDERIVPAMTRYCRWLSKRPDADFAAGYWPKLRMGDNIESIYWLYNRTGEAWLLELSRRMHAHMADWTTDLPDWHNVNLSQGFREPGVYFVQAQDEKFLRAAERNYEKLMGIYGQFPGGGFAGDEVCRPGYVDPRQGFETCGIVEFMHSFELLTRITGNPLWADRTEELAFNSLPASLTPDLKALHYLTGANMVQLDRHNKSPGLQNGGTMLSFSPKEVYRCCQHNFAHGWPYYAEELWLATADRGLCASLYADCEVTAKVADGATAKFAERTDYPFGESVTLQISLAAPTRFPLYLRVPRWCQAAGVSIGGKKQDVKAGPLSYIVLDRQWQDGDEVVLTLPMQLAVRTWAKNHNSVSVDYGPLTFSLAIGERVERYGGTDQWPETEYYPTTAWNYGLVIDPAAPGKSIKISRRAGPLPQQPFTPAAVPITATAQARKIPQWQQDSLGLVGKLQASPAKTSEPVETVTLIPMGAARLRITSFPVASDAAAAHAWQMPDQVRASHCFGNDSVEAIADGVAPKSSGDQTIPRLTFWDHRGTAEWVEYNWPSERKVKAVEVYWFDDRGRGECRVPKSWQLLSKRGDAWQPVATRGEPGTKLDQFNLVDFEPLSTRGLRLAIQLQSGFSGGILEWRVVE